MIPIAIRFSILILALFWVLICLTLDYGARARSAFRHAPYSNSDNAFGSKFGTTLDSPPWFRSRFRSVLVSAFVSALRLVCDFDSDTVYDAASQGDGYPNKI
ncbi:hypothetical protein EVAR_103402_1 [Eumeta japonica]|uniref:Uncharacterized protein n=1 Tax=Eumeta variegata TaxID=151549 RepID=A0A4C1YQV6_EUMVA|nr:hypothetical protein EVAR_103402_1 [Eumeta japonica]